MMDFFGCSNTTWKYLLCIATLASLPIYLLYYTFLGSFHTSFLRQAWTHVNITEAGVSLSANLSVITANTTNNQSLQINPIAKNIEWRSLSNVNFGKDNSYFRIGNNTINSANVTVLTKPRSNCHQDTFMLVLVPSMPKNRAVRDTIRKSWGSISKTQYWPHRHLNAKVTLIFLLARGSQSDQIGEEQKVNDDIVMLDITESYANLTRKILAGLRWVESFCAHVHFILKSDEDTFVNVPLLGDFLLTFEPKFNFAVVGFMYVQASTVNRSGRWKVDAKVYPMNKYPIYASGCAYVLSRDLASKVVLASERTAYIPIEDAFITGILVRIVDGKRIHSHMFTHFSVPRTNSCDFVHDKKLASTGMKDNWLSNIWEAIDKNKC